MDFSRRGKCPYCHSDNVDYGDFEIDDDGGVYHTHCIDCGGDYDEAYNFVFDACYGDPDKEEEEKRKRGEFDALFSKPHNLKIEKSFEKDVEEEFEKGGVPGKIIEIEMPKKFDVT